MRFSKFESGVALVGRLVAPTREISRMRGANAEPRASTQLAGHGVISKVTVIPNHHTSRNQCSNQDDFYEYLV